jgi:hypothetical protein
MIIMFIIITLLSWLVCYSQLENVLSFHSKRRLGKFLYHVRNFYITDRQRRNTLPNMKRKHKHMHSITPYVKEDKFIMFSSLIKRLFKLPYTVVMVSVLLTVGKRVIIS